MKNNIFPTKFAGMSDWVHVPPLTDIRALEKESSWKGRFINSCIFALCVLIPLGLTIFYGDHAPRWALVTIIGMYGMLTLGALLSWWVPYLLGSSEQHKAHFAVYKTTHHLLPQRGTNIVPNTFHLILHIFIGACFVLALLRAF